MKKTLAIILALVFVLSVSVSALAAPAAPAFSDLPVDHWAYPAVEQLAKAGIVDGYGDKTFRGDKPMSRYEMAQIVEKAMENSAKANAKQKALIDKLAMEFALEINKVNTRVSKLEEYNKSTLRMGYDALMTYGADSPGPATVVKARGGEQLMWRFRLIFTGDLNEKTKFLGRIGTGYGFVGNSVSNYAGPGPGQAQNLYSSIAFCDIAQFSFSNVLGFDNIKLGRQIVNELGGLVVQRVGGDDGITFTKKLGDSTTFRAGAYIYKLNDNTGLSTVYDAQELQFVSLNSQIDKNWALSAMIANNNVNVGATPTTVGYKGARITGFSSTFKLGGGWTFLTEYDMAKLSNASAIGPTPPNTKPHAYGFQITNGTVAPNSFFLVPQTMCNINKPGDSAFTIAYHYLGSGVVPPGHSPWRNATVAATSFGPNFADNVKGWSVDWQQTLIKGIVLDLTYSHLQYAQTTGTTTAIAGNKLSDIFAAALHYKF